MKKFLLCSVLIIASVLLLTGSVSSSFAGITNAGFEDGSLTSWEIGTQTGDLQNNTITISGTGVTLFSGSVTFSAGPHPGAGQPEINGAPNPYYQPPVLKADWVFSPFETTAVALQPANQYSFDSAANQLGLSETAVSSLKQELVSQAAASGYGSGQPTDAAWITRAVTLSAGVTYSMSWNYIGTDYVPFNDGSITSLVTTSATANAVTTVNNQVGSYALLGFTNPGTGDYSTGTFGSTGWQVATYQVSEDGVYILGFAVFNLDDFGLSPVLLIDSQPGGTTKEGEPFGAVAPNNPNAPTVAPTTTTQPPTTTEAPETTVPETTLAPSPPPVFVVPPVVETTTTLPVEEAPETSVPDEIEIEEPVSVTLPELPKTGLGLLQNLITGFALLALGALILSLGKELRND